MTTIHDCMKELRNADLKVTPARLGVLAALEGTELPMDVISIQKYLKNHNVKADKVTVFRIINALMEKGLAVSIQLHEDKLRYEYAGKTDHHHFICENCGIIEDISDCGIGQLQKTIEKKKGLSINQHSLEFFGLCKNCQ